MMFFFMPVEQGTRADGDLSHMIWLESDLRRSLHKYVQMYLTNIHERLGLI